MTTVQDTNTSPVRSLFGSGAAPAAAKSGVAETENRFLSLLVAQMKNQDPLNPLDNAQVTSQMAQLSTVQGIEDMNKSLAALAGSLSANQMAQAASLIGRDVLVPGSTVGPVGLENVMGFELSGPADQVTLEIRDGSGNLVRSMDLGAHEAGVTVAAWDGRAADGSAAPSGHYSFSVDAMQGGEVVGSTALNLTQVNSVSQNGQAVQLNLAGNRSIGYADIRQIF